MGSVDFQEVDEFFILVQNHFESILGICMRGSCQLFRRGLSGCFLSRKELNQLEYLTSVLLDNVTGERLHRHALHGVLEPSCDILTIPLEYVKRHRVVSHQALRCA